jgi:aryl-alcohol dehydrogenase-like predicted oxidoreductase
MLKENMNTRSDIFESSNRRSFLGTSASLAAAAILTPILSYGQDNGRSNSEISLENKRILGIGSHSLSVSTMGLGCMGMVYNRGIAPDRKIMINLIRKAFDEGVSFFDTAEVYGPFIGEELVGEALAPIRKDVVVATKFGYKINPAEKQNGALDSRPAHIKKVVDESLKRLKTDVIDLLYQHRPDPNVPIEDVAGTMKELVQSGKIRAYGLSEADAATIRAAHRVHPVTAVQSEYSLMWRQPEESVIPTCEELGVGFVPYSPIGRGYLTGALNEQTKFFKANDNRIGYPRFTSEAMRRNWWMVEALADFGQQRGISPTQVSLAWLLAKKKWIVPIPGTTKLGHLKENLLAADIVLSPQDLIAIEQATSRMEIFGKRM